MDDFALARKLEIEIDQLRFSKEPLVLQAAKDAKEALTARRLDLAQQFVTEGKDRMRPVKLLDVLIAKGNIPSRSHARRLIASGVVSVDLRIAKSGEMDVRNATSIQIKGKEETREILRKEG